VCGRIGEGSDVKFLREEIFYVGNMMSCFVKKMARLYLSD
jgi:hypothetical protein